MRASVIRDWTKRFKDVGIADFPGLFVRQSTVKVDNRVMPTAAMSFEPTEAERSRLLAGAPLIVELVVEIDKLPPLRVEVGEIPSDDSPYAPALCGLS